MGLMVGTPVLRRTTQGAIPTSPPSSHVTLGKPIASLALGLSVRWGSVKEGLFAGCQWTKMKTNLLAPRLPAGALALCGLWGQCSGVAPVPPSIACIPHAPQSTA